MSQGILWHGRPSERVESSAWEHLSDRQVPCTTRIGGIGRHAARDREIVLRKRFHVEHVEVVPRVGRPQQAAIAQDFHSCL